MKAGPKLTAHGSELQPSLRLAVDSFAWRSRAEAAEQRLSPAVSQQAISINQPLTGSNCWLGSVCRSIARTAAMALISASTILTSLCLFHITLAYFFYTNPHAIADQALVWVVGEAVGMPQTQLFSTPSPTSSLLAVILFLLGLSDLITLSMPEEIWLVHHWRAQAPARILVFGALAIFTYLTASPAPASAARHHPAGVPSYLGPAYGTASGSDGLRNRVFFTLACLEVLSWFWAWVTLREEAAAFSIRKRRRASSKARERP